ncbi:DUF4406 domain-containing protein [Neomegalonema sp.]|uniref:DUF4406 domain-containing protein n=1 Tax=Neomegalonema sp. TaxID=2039713 RepID=UPI00260A45CE|nr:DUF4406 domain-containing protein [Neomegalonema sp.]MDD2869644.1 DUF4406 domain-containing protein [Neomegalonema sp.]
MDKRDIIFFISGPYSLDPDKYIYKAEAEAAWFLEQGFSVIVPHKLYANMENTTDIDYQVFLDSCKTLVSRSDAMYMMEDWKLSKGANEELERAQKLGKLVFDNKDEVLKYDWDEHLNDTQIIWGSCIEAFSLMAKHGKEAHQRNEWMTQTPTTHLKHLLHHLSHSFDFDIDKSGFNHMIHVICRAAMIKELSK